MNHHTQHDLIIVGAGLVGASLALALKDSGLNILCLDKKPLDFHKALHTRPISLSAASILILKNLGVWSSLEALSTPIKTVHISTQANFGRLQFKADEYGLEALGAVVLFADLEQALLQAAFKNPHTGFLKIDDISALHCTEKDAEITLLSEEAVKVLRATLLVVADGVYSKARELLGIKVSQEGVKEVALTAKIKLHKPHKHVAYERFTSEGTLALLPSVHSSEVNLVWTMSMSQWETIQQKNDAELLKIVQTIFGYRLGKMQSLERSANYPIVNLSAETQIHDSAVLIGNAAHSFYPLAAQGFNLALRDVAALSEKLLKAQDKKLNNKTLLESYQQERSQDQKAVQALTKSLHEAFALRIPCFNSLRAATLLGIDLISPLKKNLAKRCLGFAGRVSKLARDSL